MSNNPFLDLGFSDLEARLRHRIAELSARLDASTDEIERLRDERDGFYMDYRMKCDEETKRLAADLAEAEALLRRFVGCGVTEEDDADLDAFLARESDYKLGVWLARCKAD